MKTENPTAEDTGRSEDSRWSNLTTEARHQDSLDLDQRGTESIVRALLAEDRRGIEKALETAAGIARAATWLAEALADGGAALLVGAGTSGRLGVLEAAECPPTFGSDPSRIRAVIAGGSQAIFEAQEGAEDRSDHGAEAVSGLERRDLLIAISASAVTPFAEGALGAARARGVRTILITCAAPSARLDAVADLVIAMDTGPEVLTGSTRLKAGSATKAALNAITTAAMVRNGKVFENLMIDLRPGSAKLRDRSLRIVAAAGRVDAETAESLLQRAGGEVKTAIVMGRLDIGTDAARRSLDRTDGNVRLAIDRNS